MFYGLSAGLLAVGYILGYRTAAMMVAGSFLSAFVLVPAILAWREPKEA